MLWINAAQQSTYIDKHLNSDCGKPVGSRVSRKAPRSSCELARSVYVYANMQLGHTNTHTNTHMTAIYRMQSVNSLHFVDKQLSPSFFYLTGYFVRLIGFSCM